MRDDIRVLVDWDDDGVFNPDLPTTDLPNLIVDPRTVATLQHEAVNGARFEGQNLLKNPTRLDSLKWSSNSTGASTEAPYLSQYYDHAATPQILTPILRVRYLSQTASGQTHLFIGGSDVPAQDEGGNIPPPSHEAAFVHTAPTLFTPLEDFYARVFIRALDEDLFQTVRVHIRKVSDNSIVVSTSTLTLGQFTVGGGWTPFSPIASGHDGSAVYIDIEFVSTGNEAFTIEIGMVGIYADTVGGGPPNGFYNSNEVIPGVWPTTLDVQNDLDMLGNKGVVGQVGLKVYLGEEADGGYRWYPKGLTAAKLQPLGVYSFVFWMREGAETVASHGLKMRLLKIGNFLDSDNYWVVKEETIPNQPAWYQYAFTFVAPPDMDQVTYGIEVIKDIDSGDTGATLEFAGWMILEQQAPPLGPNLLPTSSNEWFWTGKSDNYGIVLQDEVNDFGPLQWRVDYEQDDTRSITDHAYLNTFSVQEDDGGLAVFSDILEDGENYLMEVWLKLSEYRWLGTLDAIDTTLILTAEGEDGNVLGSSGMHTDVGYDILMNTWVRKQLILRAGRDHTTGDVTVLKIADWGPFTRDAQFGGFTLRKFTAWPQQMPDAGDITVSDCVAEENAIGSGLSFRSTNMGFPGNCAWQNIPVENEQEYMLYLDFTKPFYNDGDETPNEVVIYKAGSLHVIKTFDLTGQYVDRMYNHTPLIFTTEFNTNAIDIVWAGSNDYNFTANNVWLIRLADFPGYVTPRLPEFWNEGGREGALLGYDDITEYVLSVRTQSGKRGFDTLMAFEGTAAIQLNNADRRFSPENSDSPLFGYLRENLKVQIQLYDGEEWIPLWTGWSHNYEVEAGTARARRATLNCRQGFFRLQEGEFIPDVQEDSDVEQAVSMLVAQSGWYTLNSELQSYTDTAVIGQNAYIRDSENIFGETDPGIYPLQFIGDAWNRETALGNAITDILKMENAHLWMNRQGLLILRNREFFINPVVDEVVNITDIERVDYVYGQDIINRVEVTISPKREVTDEVIWQTKAPVKLKASKSNKPTEKVMEMDFKFEEGAPRTITKVYDIPDGSSITVYEVRQNKKRKNVFKEMSAEKVKKYIEFSTSDQNGRKYVTLKNKYERAVYIDVVVKGDYIERGEDETYVYEDEGSIQLTKTVYKETIKLNVATDEEEAESAAQHILLRQSRPVSEFPRMSFKLAGDVDRDRISAWTVGTILEFSERQTGTEGVVQVITQESFDISPREVSVTYDMAYLDDNDYVIIGDEPALGRLIYL